MNGIDDPDAATGEPSLNRLRIGQMRVHPRFRVGEPGMEMLRRL
jgi:hypothetical protein